MCNSTTKAPVSQANHHDLITLYFAQYYLAQRNLGIQKDEGPYLRFLDPHPKLHNCYETRYIIRWIFYAFTQCH
jgi:hypothetical protein